MALAISKILFILGSYNFLAYLECVGSYAWSKGYSDPDLSSVQHQLIPCLGFLTCELRNQLVISFIIITIINFHSPVQRWSNYKRKGHCTISSTVKQTWGKSIYKTAFSILIEMHFQEKFLQISFRYINDLFERCG